MLKQNIQLFLYSCRQVLKGYEGICSAKAILKFSTRFMSCEGAGQLFLRLLPSYSMCNMVDYRFENEIFLCRSNSNPSKKKRSYQNLRALESSGDLQFYVEIKILAVLKFFLFLNLTNVIFSFVYDVTSQSLHL